MTFRNSRSVPTLLCCIALAVVLVPTALTAAAPELNADITEVAPDSATRVFVLTFDRGRASGLKTGQRFHLMHRQVPGMAYDSGVLTRVGESTSSGNVRYRSAQDVSQVKRDYRAVFPGVIPPKATASSRKAETGGRPAQKGRASSRAKVSPKRGKQLVISDLGIVMQRITPGTFMMGSPSSESGRDNDERQHKVTITKPYWIGATEVTQGQWEALMGSNPSGFKGDNLPVEQVSWNEAMEYCKKLTARERQTGRLPAGYEYILPTEAQWEYACRAGTSGPYAGNLDAMGWYSKNSGSKTHVVGQKRANAWGLYDMHGNVWEWCLDRRGSYPSGSVTDPAGDSSGSDRVIRGGGWLNAARNARSAIRFESWPGYRGNRSSLGFRLALSWREAPGLKTVSAQEGQAGGSAATRSSPPPLAPRWLREGKGYTIPGLDLKLHPIPSGTHVLDSSSEGRDQKKNKKPPRRVTITNMFWLGATEVTQAQWEAIMGYGIREQRARRLKEEPLPDAGIHAWPIRGEGKDEPMYYISAREAMAFCDKLTGKERRAGRLADGFRYTLPSSDQWDFADNIKDSGLVQMDEGVFELTLDVKRVKADDGKTHLEGSVSSKGNGGKVFAYKSGTNIIIRRIIGFRIALVKGLDPRTGGERTGATATSNP